MEINKRIQLLADKLKEEESRIRGKANFCHEHKFHREEEWLRQKVNVIQEIRFEVELLEKSENFRPIFNF